MNIENERSVMIFKNVVGNKTFYNTGLSRKDLDGNWQNGTIQCKFRKDVEINNKTKIYIKKAWLDFWTKTENEKKITMPFIFINEFDIAEEGTNEKGIETEAEEIILNDEDLPF